MSDILGYARVSTGDQDVAGQMMRLNQAGAIKVFTDVMSGKSMDRPGIAELLAYARKGDTLAVVRLDRIGRSLGELLSTVKMLHERGIALLSLEEKIDTSSAAGELIFHVFGAIAHFERRLISERTKDGIAAAPAGLAIKISFTFSTAQDKRLVGLDDTTQFDRARRHSPQEAVTPAKSRAAGHPAARRRGLHRVAIA